MKETYIDIIENEDKFQVSNLGNIKSLERTIERKNDNYVRKEMILKCVKDSYGYLNVDLIQNGVKKRVKVHRLVAQAFIPNLEYKPCINHKNGIRDDNRVENLEWVTYQENEIHKRNVLGYTHSEETIKKLSIQNKKRVLINGKEFDSLGEASLYHNKYKNYFYNVINRQKKYPHRHQEWKIELI